MASRLLDIKLVTHRLSDMNYREIIAESWQYTQANKKLIVWLGFIPSIFSTTAGILYVLYQFFSLKSSSLFDNSAHSFLYDVAAFAVNTLKNSGSLMIPLIITSIVVAIIYLLLPTLCQAAAIQYIARQRNGQDVKIGDGIKYGILAFLKLFEYHTLVRSFGWVAILSEMTFVLRNTSLDIFKLLLPLFIFIFVIGLVMNLLFTYADLFIVVEEDGVMTAIKRSSKMVFLSWQHTFLITVLMMIIGVRIILQVVLILLVPALIFVTAGYFTSLAIPYLAITVATTVGAVALLLAAYLGGIVNIFAYTVWTFTFLHLIEKHEVKARDKIEATG